MKEGDLPSTPTPGATLAHVEIGQITAEPRGIAVDFLVVNISQSKIREAAITCRVRDARGSQTADTHMTVSNIAPSNVGFGQAVFPNGVATRDGRFSCEIEGVASVPAATP